MIDGAVRIGDSALEAGDAAAIQDEPRVLITAEREAEFVLFDVPLW